MGFQPNRRFPLLVLAWLAWGLDTGFARDGTPDVAPSAACAPFQEQLVRLFAQPERPESQRLFVRKEGSKITDPHYLKNITHSLQDHFHPWFEGTSDLPFRKMLADQHRTANLGRDMKTFYTSPTQEMWGTGPNRYSAGLYRLEEGISGGFRFEDLCKNHYCPADFKNHFKAVEKGRKKLWIEGIPAEHQPKRVLRNRGLFFKSPFDLSIGYADQKALGHYLDRMELLMNQLRKTPAGAPPGPWMDALADYVQLFSVALPFDTVNFSIAMSQANYILTRNGYRGISHGALDYFAMVYSSDEYRKIFRRMVDDAQKAPR